MSGDRLLLDTADFAQPNAAAGRALLPVPQRTSRSRSGLGFEQTVGQIERSILDSAGTHRRQQERRGGDAGLKRTTLAAKLRSWKPQLVEIASWRYEQVSDLPFDEPRVALNRIYTKRGDAGETALAAGNASPKIRRVSKLTVPSMS